MTAPDKNEGAKPLHERIAEHLDRYDGCTLWTALEGRGCVLLREASEALRNADQLAQACIDLHAGFRHEPDCKMCDIVRMSRALSTAKADD